VFGGEVGELREDFVDDAVVRGEAVAVDMVGEVAADEACGRMRLASVVLV
jgi:hypothetical protein